MSVNTSAPAVRGSDVVIDPGLGAVRLLMGTEQARAGVGTGARTTEAPADPGRQGPVGVPATSVTAGGANDGTAGSPVLDTVGVAVPGTGERSTVRRLRSASAG